MKRLRILVEGPTEQAFVGDLLAPHLCDFGLDVSAPCIETSRDRATGRTFRGGHARRYEFIQRHVRHLLSSDRSAQVTTMFDLYGLPGDFPGMEQAPRSPCFARAGALERSFAEDIADPRFIPNLIVHEFEALLFTLPEAIDEALPGRMLDLQRIAQAFSSPEEINDSPATAPSKRLEALFPGYGRQKPRLGRLIAGRIGLSAIRARCQHFNGWLLRLESLGRRCPR